MPFPGSVLDDGSFAEKRTIFVDGRSLHGDNKKANRAVLNMAKQRPG
jgi:hypothetical protein